jgi:glycosyltransferase involved in cell wall biosynthesis
VDIFREAGIPTRVVAAPAALNVFGKQLIHASPFRKAWLLLTSVAPYGAKLAAFMREESVDVVHFSTARGLLLGFLAPLRLRKPIVLHVHGAMQVIGRVMTWISTLAADRLVLVSEGCWPHVPAPFRRKAVVVWNARDAALPPKDALAPVPKDGPTTVLIASSLVPFKGYHHLLRAVAALNAARGPQAAPVEFVGIGETPDAEYASYIAGLKRELGVANFSHKGWQADPAAYFREADVVVLPSVERETLSYGGRERLVLGNEGFGLVLLEGMALGKPVVASRVSGPPDIVDDGVDGFLVPPGDAPALAAALGRLIDDRPLRAKLGAAARLKAESDRFSPARAARAIADVYRGLAAR